MKQVYLILAALMLLCLAPMLYGYFQPVRFVAMVAALPLLPKRFVLPPSWASHGGGVNDRVFGKQGLDVLGEGVGRIYGVEPVGNITEVRVEFVWMNVSIYNPWQRRPSWQYWHDGETAVPDTRSVEDGRRVCLIVNNKPPLFQSFNLLSEGKGLLGIVHKRINKKMARPGTLHSLRTRSDGGLAKDSAHGTL